MTPDATPTGPTPDSAPESTPERDALVRAALPHVARLGWTRDALRAGLADLGQDPATLCSLFPRGPLSALDHWFAQRDREMEAEAGDLSATRIPARIRRLVALRLRHLAPHREALRRALGQLALPWNAGLAARLLARTSSAIWHAAGDTSADFSWYTRRASLGAIYAATMAYWLRQPEETAEADTLAFLDRRLADLHRLQSHKAA